MWTQHAKIPVMPAPNFDWSNVRTGKSVYENSKQVNLVTRRPQEGPEVQKLESSGPLESSGHGEKRMTL